MSKSNKEALGLEEVAERLNRIGVHWAVFAGAAAKAYGVDRPITDIDILVSSEAGAQVARVFPEAQIKRRDDGTVWVIELTGYDILAGLNQADLDREMTERVRYMEIEGVRTPVISVEDNIALKALRGRGASEGKRDWDDVEEMLKAVRNVDWEYLYWRIEQLESKERATKVFERLEVMKVSYGL
jgi:hypothetical protein